MRNTGLTSPGRPGRASTGLGALAVVLAGCLLVAACASDGDGDGASTASPTSAGAASTSEVDAGTTSTNDTGPASTPPVSTEPIKLGVTYVDTESLSAVGLNFELGDHAAVYDALVADINDQGGIHGRQVELALAAVDPTGAEGAEAACLELAEDEAADLLTGFFLNDAVLCPLEQHQAPVVGGDMTQERVARAAAPWITWLPDWQGPEASTRALFEEGQLDGTVAVYTDAADRATVDETLLPLLDELGVEPVEVGVMGAPASDTAATQAEVQVIGERFESAGADTVVLVGSSAENWPTYMAGNTSYRPKLLFLDLVGVKAFAVNESTTDTAVLEGSLAAGGYGPDQARFEEATMQECVAILEAAGIETLSPAEAGDDDSFRPFEAAFQACPDIWLTRAWLEASGGDVSPEALGAAADGLEVTIPGDPGARVYGPAPAADGDPTSFLFAWDETAGDYVLPDG